jgi:dienelactone hydrolase
MKSVLPAESSLDLQIPVRNFLLRGDLIVPDSVLGLVLFAHGSGSGRKSSRNRYVASILQKHRIGTLLFDLLTEQEEILDARTAQLRFDIPLLAQRLIHVTDWLRSSKLPDHPIHLGYFGASTGAAAALIAAAHFGSAVSAVVSRGGRPDLAGSALPEVTAPTLLIVGGHDYPVIEMNSTAFSRLRCEKKMEIIPGATHLFEETGTLESVSTLAASWFTDHFRQN